MKSFSSKSGIYIIALISGISGMLFGYDTGVISGAILFIKQEFALNALMQELVVSGVLIGAIIGAFIGGFLADRYGRRKMIILAGLTGLSEYYQKSVKLRRQATGRPRP